MLGALECVVWHLDGKAPWAPRIQPKLAAVTVLAHAVDLVGRGEPRTPQDGRPSVGDQAKAGKRGPPGRLSSNFCIRPFAEVRVRVVDDGS